jgi:hypothetical protein
MRECWLQEPCRITEMCGNIKDGWHPDASQSCSLKEKNWRRQKRKSQKSKRKQKRRKKDKSQKKKEKRANEQRIEIDRFKIYQIYEISSVLFKTVLLANVFPLHFFNVIKLLLSRRQYLEVSMDNFFIMKVTQRFEYLKHEEPGLVL